MACRPTSPLDQSPGMEKWSQMQVLTQVDAQLAIWNCMDDPSDLKRTIILKLRYQAKRSSVTRARLPKDFTILERLERMENQIFEIPQKSQAKFDKDSDKLYWKLLADLKKDDQDLIEYKREMDTTIVDLNYKITEANMSISGIQRLSAEMKAASSQKSQELEERMQELEAHIMDLRKAMDDVPRAPVVSSKRASVAKLEEVIPVVPVPAAAPPAKPVIVIPEVQLSPPPTVPAPAPPASAPGMSPAMGFSIDLEPRLLSIINRLNGDAMKQATGMKKTLQELEVKLDALEIATVSTEKRIIFLTSAAEAETDADNPESIKRILKNDTDLREARGQLLVIDSTLSSMLSTVKSARSDMMDMLNSPTLEEDGIMTPKDKAELDGMVELAEAFWTRLKSLEILLNTCYDHCRRHDKVYGKRWLGVVGGSSSSDTTRLIEQMATALRKYGEEIELLKEEKPSIDYVNSLIQESLSSSMSDFESKVNHMLFKLRMRNVEQMIRGEGEGGGSQESLTKKDDDDQSREDLEGMLEPLIRDIVEMYLGISQGEGGSETDSFDLDLKADVRLLEAMERNLRNIMLEVGDLRNLHAEEIGQVKEALEKSVKKTLRVLFSSQDDQAKPTFLATKSLCLSCGRNSVVKASADPTSPPSFLPQLHAASTPGPEVYRAGFKMPVLNRESLLTAPAIGGAQRLTEAPDLTVVNSKKEEGGVGEGSSLVNVSGTDDHESVASGEGGRKSSGYTRAVVHAGGREDAMTVKPIHRRGLKGKKSERAVVAFAPSRLDSAGGDLTRPTSLPHFLSSSSGGLGSKGSASEASFAQ
eukprot:gene2014-2392_t